MPGVTAKRRSWDRGRPARSLPKCCRKSGRDARGPSGLLLLMQLELAGHGAKFSRLDQPAMTDHDRMQNPFQLAFPKFQKLRQFWKMRVKIVVLPDIALQERRVVGHSIENVSGRQPETLHLAAEVV
jgi:hypothetical protein